MAIRSELQSDGRLILQWSDDNRYLVKQDGSGQVVIQALDPVGMFHEYVEGDKIPAPPVPERVPVEEPEPEPTGPTVEERLDDVEAALIELAALITEGE